MVILQQQFFPSGIFFLFVCLFVLKLKCFVVILQQQIFPSGEKFEHKIKICSGPSISMEVGYGISSQS